MDKPDTRSRAAKLLPAVILICVTLFFALGSLTSGDRSTAARAAVWKPLLKLHDSFRLGFGADCIGDVYLADGRLLRRAATPNEDTVTEAARIVNDFAGGTDTPVYCAAVPTSAGIYADLLDENAPVADEAAVLRAFFNQLDSSIVRIELLPQLNGMREDSSYELYYRTDPRWTSFGAFCGYQTVIRKLGYSALGYDKFTVTHFDNAYFGSLAQEIQYFSVQPDLIDLYSGSSAPAVVSGTIRYGDGTAAPCESCYDTNAEGYDVFTASAVPVLHLETDLQNGRQLLLICDSFGAPMLPFLMQHYHSITAVSLEHAADMNWQSDTEGEEYTQILILCSAETLADTDLLRALSPAQIRE